MCVCVQDDGKGTRALAVAMLCALAHSTELPRDELWANDGVRVFLGLLKEEVRGGFWVHLYTIKNSRWFRPG